MNEILQVKHDELEEAIEIDKQALVGHIFFYKLMKRIV